MGQRGPAPKPKILRAPTGRNRIARGRPEKPRALVGEASAEWDRIIPELEAAGMLAVVDRAGLIGYCLAFSQMCAADSILQAEGIICSEPIQNAAGKVIAERIKAHPAVAIHAEASRRVLAYIDRFGLTPAARQRLEGGGPAAGETSGGNRVLAIRDRIEAARGG